MPTIANMPAADVRVEFPSGAVKTVNLLRLLVQTQNAEFKAKHGMFLPGVGKQHPTVRALREEYEIPVADCKTWADAATLLRRFHTALAEAVR
jgi:imidazoleglycerol phosphate synthase glutamine amidotransferase subunit HisH